MSFGEGASLSCYMIGPECISAEIAVSRHLDADEAARLAGDGASRWERPAETTRYADVAVADDVR